MLSMYKNHACVVTVKHCTPHRLETTSLHPHMAVTFAYKQNSQHKLHAAHNFTVHV